jgi:hypothetical protein
MRIFLSVLSILFSLSIFGLVGYDFLSLPGTYDSGNMSYTIFSSQRITIDGQWGYILCMAMALAIAALQVVQFLPQRARATPDLSNQDTTRDSIS